MPIYPRPYPRFLGSGHITIAETDITDTSWVFVGGIVTDPAFFEDDMEELLVKVIGVAKVTGGTAELRLVQDVIGGATTVITEEVSLADTSGAWALFDFNTNAVMTAGDSEFRVEARVVTASCLCLRSTAMTLLCL